MTYDAEEIDGAQRLERTTDGIVTIRPPEPGDARSLVAGRDVESERWLGPGTDNPQPTGCVVVDGQLVGWVDYDTGRPWHEPGEVNIGYNVFAPHRGQGYGTRALQLLMHHLAMRTEHRTATLLIDPGNERSLALAQRTRFTPAGEVNGQRYFKRAVPPLTYSDGVVTIRRQRIADLAMDIEAKDDAQIDWLWLPGQRESWVSMTPEQQHAHALRGLKERHDKFGTGPSWTFSVDAVDAEYVSYVDCDLANPDVPHGEANVSYSAHPAYRGRGYVSRSVRLIARFVRDHTGARQIHICVDPNNVASLRVANAVGSVAGETWINDRGEVMIRHILDLSSAPDDAAQVR